MKHVFRILVSICWIITYTVLIPAVILLANLFILLWHMDLEHFFPLWYGWGGFEVSEREVDEGERSTETRVLSFDTPFDMFLNRKSERFRRGWPPMPPTPLTLESELKFIREH